jgi:glycosyltransferase involved in cell wall biosynthesis
MTNNLSIIVVNYNSYDFTNLLIKTCNKLSQQLIEIIVIDNSKTETFEYSNVSVFLQPHNIGHGQGINLGVQKASSDILLILDSDCHFLSKDFDQLILKEMQNCDVLAVPGSIEKPIRASCLCIKKEIAINYDFKSTPDYKGHRITPHGYDTAILAYYKMLQEKREIKWFDTIKPNRYKTLNGEEYALNNKSMIYHHWHGSHLTERQVDFKEDLQKDKEFLFNFVLDD